MYRLMIVDDEPLTREYLKRYFQSCGGDWEVAAEAMDGSEAWELLQSRPVDVVITDIKMPVMNGLDLCKLVSERYPHMKLVILSGYDEFSFAREAIQYGVHDYLLKPIVKENLDETVRRIAADLDKARHEDLALRTLRSLSNDTTSQVIKHFLKAAVAENELEIKTLYPLMYRLNLSLIEAEGAVMMLDLDMHHLLHSSVPVSDVALFRFILHQVAGEIVQQEGLGTAFLDEHQQVCCLIAGDNEEEIRQRSSVLHEKTGNFMRQNTNWTVTSALGSAEDDVLKMHQSYYQARRAMYCRLLAGGDRLYVYAEQQPLLRRVGELEQSVASIQSVLLDGTELAPSLTVGGLVDLMEKRDGESIFRYGVLVIQHLAEIRQLQLRDSQQGEAAQLALAKLKNAVLSHPEDFSKEKAVSLLVEIVNLFRAANRVPDDEVRNEKSIVEQAKDYICSHYSEPLSLAHIAEKVGVSTAYLSNLFHKQMNESYIKFLTRVRMEQAARLLKLNPPEKVYDVARKVGYISVKHFSHVFKQYYGTPPGEYANPKS
ncbi:hypothetical protein SD70_19880 [Gordoniibacillus kamchatkensis]|uniref:Response regulator n=1 Tax=Gordoniibacillus kamchatkensis TaxID=1590651 RepID=A0ABR5AEK4_9BACL|nr:response regulator [Paenibacillus sp. VKM B-2647]KIL39439.1 hypothetical protein SD70_19880 [Paenibacillus sp. VKM B-2647]